jgi:hypothetical protein
MYPFLSVKALDILLSLSYDILLETSSLVGIDLSRIFLLVIRLFQQGLTSCWRVSFGNGIELACQYNHLVNNFIAVLYFVRFGHIGVTKWKCTSSAKSSSRGTFSFLTQNEIYFNVYLVTDRVLKIDRYWKTVRFTTHILNLVKSILLMAKLTGTYRTKLCRRTVLFCTCKVVPEYCTVPVRLYPKGQSKCASPR